MSIISASVVFSGMGVSSSSSDASSMAQSTGSSGAGSGSMCLAKSSSREWSAAAYIKQVAKERKTRTRLQNPFLSKEATLSHLTYVILFNSKGRNGAVCLASACYISRLLPPAPRASRALPGPGRRCTSAASRANPYKTAPAPCRRPGTRTGQRRGRHPTPGDPALWTRAKTKAQILAKGTTERAIHRTKEKTTSVIFFKKKMSRERIYPHYGFNFFEIIKPHKITSHYRFN